MTAPRVAGLTALERADLIDAILLGLETLEGRVEIAEDDGEPTEAMVAQMGRFHGLLASLS